MAERYMQAVGEEDMRLDAASAATFSSRILNSNRRSSRVSSKCLAT
jgi:hypothetical protein